MADGVSCPACETPLPEGVSDCPRCQTVIREITFAPSATLFPEISGYKITDKIGQGGMGAIYLAEELALGRRVAIKMVAGKLATDPQSRTRFLREARALATVEHPNVVRIYSYGEVGEEAYLVMEFVDGETLGDRITRQGRLPVGEALRTLRQIIEALEAAWERSIVHRDVKPANILVDRRNRIHVADFGLAKPVHLTVTDASLTQAGYMLGTPHYVAPEQALGNPVDFRADVYSCGIVLYEMLTGERPFEGTTPFAIVAQHLNDPLPPIREKRSDVPAQVVPLLEWMTEKMPSKRPASYAEILSKLDAILGATTPEAMSVTAIQAAGSPRRWPYAAVGMVVFLAAGLLVWRQSGWKKNAAPPQMPTPADSRLVVAVAPFYGPDADSAKEGRMMAALVERAIVSRLGRKEVLVVGIDETKEPQRSHEAARQLGERHRAAIVVWGESFALGRETEIQPYFTLVQQRPDEKKKMVRDTTRVKALLKQADPVEALREQAAGVVRVESAAPNQIELRKTSAEGVGEMVSFLAGIHALYGLNDPQKALQRFGQAPDSAALLRHRAEALIRLERTEAALATLEEAARLEPQHVGNRAQLADLYWYGGGTREAIANYRQLAGQQEAYTTSHAIFHEGRLYARELMRAGPLSDRVENTGYLVVIDPLTMKTVTRYRLSEVIKSFRPVEGGFAVTCAVSRDGSGDDVYRFARGTFDRPVHYGGNVALRMRTTKAAWHLVSNYDKQFTTIMTEQPVHPKLAIGKTPSPGAPATLQELEGALRAAVERDATQPWYRFHLGLTLWEVGKSAEAEQIWTAMLAHDFPGVPYWNYAWMAKHFERLGHPSWADRAFEKSLVERRRLPQPIVPATLIERLINVPVMRLHPSQLADAERAYSWLTRARVMTGPTEADHLASAAWVEHFRRSGRHAEANREAAFQRMALDNPLNFTAQATKLDYAIALAAVMMFGFLSFGILLFVTAVGRSFRSEIEGDGPLRMERLLRWWKGRDRNTRFFHTALGVILAFLVLWALAITSLDNDWRDRAAVLFVLAILIFLVVLRMRGSGLTGVVRSISRRERAALTVSVLTCCAAAFFLAFIETRFMKLQGLPIGLADSLGHASILEDLEKRLTDHDTPERRYTAAVANHLAGKRERANMLYQSLGNDPRARNGIASLSRGDYQMAMPSLHELLAAYIDFPLKEFPHGPYVVFTLAVVTIVSFRFVAPSTTQPRAVTPPKTRAGRIMARLGFLFLPGSYDVRRGSPWKGLLSVTLFGVLLGVLVLLWKTVPVAGSPGIMTALSMPNLAASFPLPPDVAFRQVAFFAHPYAKIFWGMAGLAIMALAALHGARIPAILRLYGESGAHEPATIANVEQGSRR